MNTTQPPIIFNNQPITCDCAGKCVGHALHYQAGVTAMTGSITFNPTTQPYTEASAQEALAAVVEFIEQVPGWRGRDDLRARAYAALNTTTEDAALEQLAQRHPIDLPWMQEDVQEVRVAGQLLGTVHRIPAGGGVTKYYGKLAGATLATGDSHQSPLQAAEDVLLMAQGKPAYVAQATVPTTYKKLPVAQDPFLVIAEDIEAPKCSPLSCDGCPACEPQ